ncbi:MAG: AMP-binding protein, partial [Lachnospiraceae bacterium]|nr:AMP-binding protein [Lachnospiraceae bacterium]
IEYIIKDSGAVITITEEVLQEGLKEKPLPPERWADPDPHDMAFIFYTSGSTGKPKGAVQEYGIYSYIMDSTRRAIDKWDFLDYANVAPETYIGGIDLMIGALQAGHTLHLIPLELVRDPVGLLTYFKEQHITGSCMPPTLIKVLESIGGLDLKILHVTGEITTELYIDRFPVRNAYGPTELSYLPFFFEIDKPYSITPIGTPDKNTEVLLINENGEKDPNEGMLCIHLPYFRGYLHDKERAELITVDGKPYFKTGDYTSLDPDGNYTILGRMDDMVKINGNRIEPSEVEFAIKKVLGTDFAAVKVWDRGGSQYLCAYHTCGKELDAAEMAEKLKDYLPLYMIPACYISLDEIPLNENGKVNKMVLPRPDESALFAPYAPPENELQKKLCAAFADALKIDRERYGIDDDFFLLGGDSLAAIRVITQVEHSDLTVIMIYRERTVRGIERALQSTRETAKRMKISMNAFYILATALSLMVYNNAENAVFLWTFNGRSEIKAIRTVGLLLRDFPVDLSLDKVDTVRAAASSINRQIREAILHGSFTPFADGEPLDFLYQGDLFKTRDYEELIDIDSPETQEETAMEPIELHVYEDDDGS